MEFKCRVSLFQDQQEQQAMMQDPVYNYFPGLETGVESAGPIFNIQVGAKGIYDYMGSGP